jgi:exosortase B
MAHVFPAAGPSIIERPWLAWLPVAAGLAALYVPSYLVLDRTIWATEENGHGPIVLAVVVWLVWRKRTALIDGIRKPSPVLGAISLLCGLLLFVIGHSQSIEALAVASHIPVLIGVLLMMRGWAAVRSLWFALFFLFFLIPLPGILVDPLTSTLKQEVSGIVESVLYFFGYPIGRQGVTLQMGQYQLLMADACSGLNSIFSLGALGLLYLYLMQYKSRLHNALIMLAIVPIAIAANVVRVITLVLVTYYFGDAVGQGFAHSAAGMLLFVAALLMLLGFDSLLRWIFRRREQAAA